MVFESKYAESVKDWKTYSSLSGVQLWYFQEDLRLCVGRRDTAGQGGHGGVALSSSRNPRQSKWWSEVVTED